MQELNVVRFGIVIEGHGEVEAVPLLIRRIGNEICGLPVQTTRPVRITKTSLVRPGGLERAIRLAQRNAGPLGPVVVMLDADNDCPARLGPDLKARALPIAQGQHVAIVIPKMEFESWFLAPASSLAGKRGLRPDLTAPQNPEEIRGAKEWLSRGMIRGRAYSPTVDQAPLAAGIDLVAARVCHSFDRFVREISRLLNPDSPGRAPAPPC